MVKAATGQNGTPKWWEKSQVKTATGVTAKVNTATNPIMRECFCAQAQCRPQCQRHYHCSACSQSKVPPTDRAQVGQRNRCPWWDSLANSCADIFMQTQCIHWLHSLHWTQKVLQDWLHYSARIASWSSCHLVNFMQKLCRVAPRHVF